MCQQAASRQGVQKPATQEGQISNGRGEGIRSPAPNAQNRNVLKVKNQVKEVGAYAFAHYHCPCCSGNGGL